MFRYCVRGRHPELSAFPTQGRKSKRLIASTLLTRKRPGGATCTASNDFNSLRSIGKGGISVPIYASTQ